MTDVAAAELPHASSRNQLEIGSDWQFIMVAVPQWPTQSENDCWFKKDGSAAWQRIENTGDCWRLLEPLLGVRRHNGSGAPALSKPEKYKSQKRSVAKVVCGIVVVAIASFGGIYRDVISKRARELLAPTPGTQFSADIEEGLAKAVVKIRAELPKRIDPMTTLVWASYSGTKMIYENRLEMDAAKVDDGIRNKLSQLVTVNTCASPASRKLLDFGGSYRYVYSDMYAKIVMTLEIDKDKCS